MEYITLVLHSILFNYNHSHMPEKQDLFAHIMLVISQMQENYPTKGQFPLGTSSSCLYIASP